MDAIWRSEKLISLKESFQERLKSDRAPTRLLKIIDDLFSIPAVNVGDVMERTGISKPTASNDIARLERLGILREYTHRERDRDWIARDIIHVIEQEGPDE